MKHKGSCHCGAIRIELRTERQPQEQVIGACQCSFCRKHNARTFSDPKAFVTLTAHEPEHLRRYEFGLKTSEQIICGRCGVYVAMTIIDAERVLSVINIDVLDDRASFNRDRPSYFSNLATSALRCMKPPSIALWVDHLEYADAI